MTNNQQDQNILELSVADLFKQGQYIIPIYQRNYAWGESEVEQLLQDILDSAKRDNTTHTAYYIGSLVVYQRENGTFETIDGQQRHTTLGIILSVLTNEFSLPLNDVTRINLGFDSRHKSNETLRSLFNGNLQDNEERTMRSAYQVVNRFFVNEKNSVTLFKDFLLNNVKILRVIVPQDTDLNHYFEIMNNRGEQLEKHEVLKARLMDSLDTEAQRLTFAKTWDACADMNLYVQLAYSPKVRVDLFGEQWNRCPQNFQELECLTEKTITNKGASVLADIIEQRCYHNNSVPNNNEGSGTFSSIINFSNFLLHVLRVTTKQDVPLDDKRLLDTFTDYKPDAQSFLVALLKCRILFDRYILKRENDEDWSLKKIRPYQNKNVTFSYVNSVTDESQNAQLVMLLSMFHVSFPALVYKHWLNAALNYLYEKTESKISKDGTQCLLFVDGADYLSFMEKLSDRFFFGRFGVFESESPTDYFDLTFGDPVLPTELNFSYLQQGTAVQNFIFNRLDYLLWKTLKANDLKQSEEEFDLTYVNKRLNGFSFTFRTSVEHYFPQHPLGSEPMSVSGTLPDGVDSFGNLCLISRSDNSKLSNYLPIAKKEHYEKATTVESLKQVFMMSYADWGIDSVKNIKDHEEMMIKILCQKESSLNTKSPL